ncbi:MAG: hypothetical protein JXB49_26585 [Bacteroidales bacterium]|nr:hypothetical protein [Bacteroidales bacterium]
MGTRYLFKCEKCGYQVSTSGGKDYGWHATIDTYICKSCKEIVDICVGEYGETYAKEEAQFKKQSGIELDFYKCPECGSDKNLVKWDKRKRPCPKCGGRMVIRDDFIEITNWD